MIFWIKFNAVHRSNYFDFEFGSGLMKTEAMLQNVISLPVNFSIRYYLTKSFSLGFRYVPTMYFYDTEIKKFASPRFDFKRTIFDIGYFYFCYSINIGVLPYIGYEKRGPDKPNGIIIIPMFVLYLRFNFYTPFT